MYGVMGEEPRIHRGSGERPTIESLVGNGHLAAALRQSAEAALWRQWVNLGAPKDADELFARSLDAARAHIADHPREQLFRRLLETGVADVDEPKIHHDGAPAPLSLDECHACVEFVYSHMVNRFQGELAELLALKPCIELVERLRDEGRSPAGATLFWGDTIAQRCGIAAEAGPTCVASVGGFAKGADGLLVEAPDSDDRPPRALGVVEVKSARRSRRRVLGQIARHAARLARGARLGGREWPTIEVEAAGAGGLARVTVMPSSWLIPRPTTWRDDGDGRKSMVYDASVAPAADRIEEAQDGSWHVTLAWSQEALAEAAYEMTFHYMAEVGEAVYSRPEAAAVLGGMTPAEAGYNAIKERLYHVLMERLAPRCARLATRLYNVYCFGYGHGVDSREMLWPEDLPGA
jgi:hypothetical protein